MAYTYEQVFAADPANPANIAQSASVKIFAPGDATKTAIAITDTSGTPLPNPIPVNANGFGPAFSAAIDRVAWEGGGFTGFFTSYEGLKEEAVAAREAAQEAASTAGVDAAAVATAAIGDATAEAEAAAASAAASAISAANAAATTANYLNLAKNPDLLIAGTVTRVDGRVTSAPVVWPDGSPGTFTPTYDTSGAVQSYTITYGSPVTKTYTQPAITRDASGAATTIPQIVVS